MTDSSEDLLLALGQLQGMGGASTDGSARPVVDRVKLMTAVLTSARGAGLTPEQTVELMRGLGIVDGPAKLDSAPPEPPPPVQLALAPAPMPSPPPPEVPPPEAPPPEAPAPVERLQPAPRLPPPMPPEAIPGTARKGAPLRPRNLAAYMRPPSAPSTSTPRAAVPDPTPTDYEAQATRSTRPVSTPARLKASDQPVANDGGRQSSRFRMARPSEPPGARPGALLGLPTTTTRSTVPRRSRPVRLASLAEPVSKSEPQHAPSQTRDRRTEPSAHTAALVEEAARALSDSLEDLDDAFDRAESRSANVALGVPKPRSANPSSPSRLLDINIDEAPPFTGSWTWHDTNIRSALRGTLPALLMRWVREAATHRVELLCGRARGELVLADGRLVGVRTNIVAVQLGKILVDRARIPPSAQGEARALRTPRELETWAARTGLLTPNQMHEVGVAMMRTSLSMCLGWPGGTFRVFRRPAGAGNETRLQVAATLLGVVNAVPVQLALNCLEQLGARALLRGPRIQEGAALSRDPVCSALMNRRAAATPLAEVLRRLDVPTLDAARRVVLLTEMEILAIGEQTDAVGALEVRRKSSLRVSVSLDVTPLAERFKLNGDDADILTRLVLQACLVHVPKTDDATVDELVGIARMAISRDARPAETTATDRAMLQAFTAHGLSVPDMCRFCALLVDWLGLLGVDLHRLVPSKSVLGVVLYTNG
ncbi:MAG: hypothetical protein ACI9U2_002588 [Bradymonadia bacterium]|jgi:hypothetical protein